MDTINLSEAKVRLSQRVERAAKGEGFTTATAGCPLPWPVPLVRRVGARPLGLLIEQVRIGSNFDDPLPTTIHEAFEGKLP